MNFSGLKIRHSKYHVEMNYDYFLFLAIFFFRLTPKMKLFDWTILGAIIRPSEIRPANLFIVNCNNLLPQILTV